MTASRTILQKYLPSAQEVTERDVVAAGAKPGTPKFQKVREDLILTKLDARPKKIPPPETTAPAPRMPVRVMGGRLVGLRRMRVRRRAGRRMRVRC